MSQAATRPAEKDPAATAPANGGSPIKDVPAFWRRVNAAAVIGIFMIMLGVVAYLARPILLPVVAATIIGSTIGPAADRVHRHGVPPLIASLAIVSLFLLALYILIIAMSAPLSSWIGRAPELQAIFKEKLSALERPLSALREVSNAINNLQSVGPAPNLAVDVNRGSLIDGILSFLTPALTGFVIFFGSLLLFLAGRKDMKKKLTLSFMEREARLTALHIIADIESSLTTYIFTVSAINVGLGVCTGVAMYVLGMPNAPMLGVAATILNYLPYVGPATTAVILFLVSLVTFPTLSYAVLAPCLFVGLAFIEGQFITPAILGHRLTINPLAVFLSIAFWAWLWGPMGAFLAVPLLLIAIIIGRHLFPEDKIELPG
jgi:predicted PurR-regulated permease PerM